MNRLAILSLTLLLFFACGNSRKQFLFALFDRVDGLDEGSRVVSNGLKIGEVVNLTLYSDKVLVKLVIEPQYKIPLGSKIFLEGESVISGNSVVDIKPSKNHEFHKEGDTLIAEPISQPKFINQEFPNDKIDSNSMKPVKKIIEGVNQLLKIDTTKGSTK